MDDFAATGEDTVFRAWKLARPARGRLRLGLATASAQSNPLPESLPRIERVIEPESTPCPGGCGEMVCIGEDRAERLDIVPAQLRAIVTGRAKHACRRCEQGVTRAPAPTHLGKG